MKLAKDVIILDIRKYRILALVPSGFFTSLCSDSQQAEKCDTSVGELDFLCYWRADMAFGTHDVRVHKFLFGAACGKAFAEGGEEKVADQEAGGKMQKTACRSGYWKYRRFGAV